MEKGVIEVAPLAFMRGRTLNDSFIILDEAQNTSPEQMQMFLTRLGFLPGDLLAKVDPYMRPLFDALYDMMDPEKLTAYMERGTIEVAPLAFMRGRTLNDSFIILDEAQNTSPEQMQMFLTRLGFGSKVVVTGDVTQVDLPREQASGLIHVQDILGSIDGIAFVRFGHEDVVRHKLVQRIVEAYKLHAEETGTQRRK
jgi:phosphate starvation-inducible PhoH-like protein